jgi:hypothetical protein
MDRFITAQSLSSRLSMPQPLSRTQMSAPAARSRSRSGTASVTVMRRARPPLPLVARRLLSTSSASAYAAGWWPWAAKYS